MHSKIETTPKRGTFLRLPSRRIPVSALPGMTLGEYTQFSDLFRKQKKPFEKLYPLTRTNRMHTTISEIYWRARTGTRKRGKPSSGKSRSIPEKCTPTET